MRRRLWLLGGQTIALGLTMAFLVVPASSVFLSVYGAKALPYTYLSVAAAGVVVSTLMTRAQRRWSLARVTVLVLSSYIVIVAAAWLALATADATWVTFVLVVLFPLSIPIGFVLVGTQAVRLLDVREMKAHFPRVAAGFAAGFAAGGLIAAPLVGVFGGPVPLLGLDVLAAVGLLAVAAVTARTYPDQLATPPDRREARRAAPEAERQAPLRLRDNRLVVLVFGYQVLSAVVTQLLDYMVWERAAFRYPDPSDLARFLGLFGAVINVVSIAFVALVAGRLLTRYGVRLGLAANPAGVLVLLVVSAVTGYAAGPASTAFFLLVCAQQVTDISLTDGTTRTSINATYQALPPAMRAAAQTRVEGTGVPLSLGFVGLLLLVVNALDVDVVTLVVITAVITVVWLVLAFAAFGGYRVNLQRTLTRREWDPVDLRLDDQTRPAIDALIASDDVRDLRLGLDVLADTDAPDLAQQVLRPLRDQDPERRLVAVAAASRALGSAVDRAWVPAALEPLRDDPDERVRTAVEIALARAGGSADRARATQRWAGELRGGDGDRVVGALVAAAAMPDATFGPGLLSLAASPHPPAELHDALSANADHLAGAIGRALSGADELGRSATLRLVAALGESGSDVGRSVLLGHLGHPDAEIADAVLDALVAAGPVPPDDRPAVHEALHREAERASRVLAALDVLAGAAGVEHVVRALQDEDARASRRALALVGLLDDPAAMVRTVDELGSADRALALESLEVTVGRELFPLALALLDPGLDPGERRDALSAIVRHVPPADPGELLWEIIEDPGERWQDPWLRACALHALVAVAPGQARLRAQRFVGAPDPVTAETAAWVLGALPAEG